VFKRHTIQFVKNVGSKIPFGFDVATVFNAVLTDCSLTGN
jgi:hypothetical protein